MNEASNDSKNLDHHTSSLKILRKTNQNRTQKSKVKEIKSLKPVEVSGQQKKMSQKFG
jgi:hypothetical protein